MRTLLAPDDMVAELIAKRRAHGWDGYDYEIDGVYHVSPLASYNHGSLQARVTAELFALAPPTNWPSCSAFVEHADISRQDSVSADAERFDRAYYRRYYGARPVHRPSDIAALAQGVLGLCRWWGIDVRSVLDVGAGPGYWRDALPKGVRYQGIDVSEHACATYGHERRDISTWGPRRPYDLVVAQGVLQYLDGSTCSEAIEHLSVATRSALYLEVPTSRDRTEVLDGDRSDTTAHFRSGTWYRQRLGRHFVAAGAGLWLKPHTVRLYELEGGVRLAVRPARRGPASG